MDFLNTPEKNKINNKYATPTNETPKSRRRRKKNKSQAIIAAKKEKEKALAPPIAVPAVHSISTTAFNSNATTNSSSDILRTTVSTSNASIRATEIVNTSST